MVFPLLKTVSELINFDALSAFSLRMFFIQGNQKNVAQGEIGLIERVGHRIMLGFFGQKLLNTL